jgi:hypothetical protein
VPDERPILAPVSAGELLDKISILKIKVQRLTDPAKRALAGDELSQLLAIAGRHIDATAVVLRCSAELQDVNERLWDIEDDIRRKEHAGLFDRSFIELARAVYLTNDRRAAIKRALNDALGSQIVEVKEYA